MERGLIHRGHFAYESGHHGDLWLDLDGLFARPGTLRTHVMGLADLLRPYHPEVVCGPLTGGAYLAQLVAIELDTAFCWTTQPAYALAPAGVAAGRRAAIVDDAVNAGSAATATATALLAAGATVVATAALATLGSAPTAIAGAPVLSLEFLPSTLWPAAACPRCAAGSPLDDPPS